MGLGNFFYFVFCFLDLKLPGSISVLSLRGEDLKPVHCQNWGSLGGNRGGGQGETKSKLTTLKTREKPWK